MKLKNGTIKCDTCGRFVAPDEYWAQDSEEFSDVWQACEKCALKHNKENEVNNGN